MGAFVEELASGLGERQAFEPPESTPKASRSNPLSPGQSAVMTIGKHVTPGGHTFEVQVAEVLRGEEAWSEVHEDASLFRVKLGPGEELLVLRAKANYLNGPPDELMYLGTGSWDFVSQNGVRYESGLSLDKAEPEFSFEFFPGASIDGWVQQVVRIDYPSPLAVFGASGQLAGGIWFKLDG